MSVSIAELVGSKALQKYHKIVTTVVTITLICSLWLGSGVVRAAAADNPSQFSFTSVYIVNNSQSGLIYEDSYGDILIPVYFWYNAAVNDGFLNGTLAFNVGSFTYKDSNNVNVPVNYFEAVNLNGLSTRYDNRTGNGYIYFDNFHNRKEFSQLIGYFHVSVNTTAASTIVYSNSLEKQATITYNYVYHTDYEFGLENAVIAAINDSSDINSIILHLLNIQNNTALLDYIIDYLANNRNLTEIYNQLVSLNATETRLYNEIYNYIHQSNTGANAASQAASELGSEAANQGNIEESLVALAPGNISDLDSADAFGVLDDIQLSTAFWVDAVHQFSIESGILWGIFIFALIIGLIAFILRLR